MGLLLFIKFYYKSSMMILTFANYFPSILSAKFLSNSKTEAGAVFTFVGLIEAIKYFFLIFIVIVLSLYGSS